MCAPDRTLHPRRYGSLLASALQGMEEAFFHESDQLSPWHHLVHLLKEHNLLAYLFGVQIELEAGFFLQFTFLGLAGF